MPPRRPQDSPQQPDFFDADAAASPDAGRAMVALPTGAGATLSKAQQTFNRLVEQVERLRVEWAMWQDYELRHRRFVAEKIEPLQRETRAVEIELLQLADRLLVAPAPPRLSKVQARKLRGLIVDLGGEILAEAPNAEIEALFDRHADQSWQDQQAAELADAESLFGTFLGDDAIKGHSATTFDDLARHVAGHMADQAASAEQAREDARREGRLGRRAAAAAARKEQAQREASQSVRDVFRRLASALHPDRETDATERERKTMLMQRANEAYARDDLLALLNLQLELDHIDAAHLAGLSDERIALYNHVLRDQARALEQEIETATAHYKRALGLPLLGRLKATALVEAAVAADLAERQRLLRHLRGDLAALADPATRTAAIARLADPLRCAPSAFGDLTDMIDDPSQFADEFGPRRNRPRR